MMGKTSLLYECQIMSAQGLASDTAPRPVAPHCGSLHTMRLNMCLHKSLCISETERGLLQSQPQGADSASTIVSSRPIHRRLQARSFFLYHHRTAYVQSQLNCTHTPGNLNTTRSQQLYSHAELSAGNISRGHGPPRCYLRGQT